MIWIWRQGSILPANNLCHLQFEINSSEITFFPPSKGIFPTYGVGKMDDWNL